MRVPESTNGFPSHCSIAGLNDEKLKNVKIKSELKLAVLDKSSGFLNQHHSVNQETTLPLRTQLNYFYSVSNIKGHSKCTSGVFHNFAFSQSRSFSGCWISKTSGNAQG